MQFLRTLFWVVLAVVGVIFAIANRRIVEVYLWSDIVVDMPLWLVALISFLVGLVPMLVLHRATRWSLRRRLDSANRALGDVRAVDASPGTPMLGDHPSITAVPPAPHRSCRHPASVDDGMTSPIWVAIDTPDIARAQAIATGLGRHVGGIKLGLEFFCANGRAGVRTMSALGLPVFLDLKLHDIPNTVAKAVQSLSPLIPAILTVHAGGGRAMMEDAKAAAPSGCRVVAVTVLTSLDAGDLASAGVAGNVHDQVLRLTAAAREAGLDGVVCSGSEVAAAHAAWHDGFFVVPGVRPSDGDTADQKRVVTPRAALDAGASILVVGRPITQAQDPLAAVRAIESTL